MAKTYSILAILFLAFTLTAAAQTNGTISCAGGPLRSTETYGAHEDTDNGLGRLQMTTNCTVVPNTGATGYLSALYSSNTYTTNHAVNVTLTSGLIVSCTGCKAGWTFDLEVTLPDSTNKHYKMNYQSGSPAPNNQHDQQWPISVNLPAGSKFHVDVYAFADDVSACAATCYGSAQWNLQ